jgi:hypothetical protein
MLCSDLIPQPCQLLICDVFGNDTIDVVEGSLVVPAQIAADDAVRALCQAQD